MTSSATRLRRTVAPIAVLLAGLVLTGCGALTGSGADDDSGNGPRVVAAFYPLAWVAERVAGEHATVDNLTAAGSEPHDLALTVRETGQVAGADLVVHLSEFQPAVDATVEQNAEGAVLDVADVVELAPYAEHSDEAHAEEEAHAGEEHADEEAHAGEDHADEEEHADEEAHEHGDEDPHFWLDPALMADLGDALADRLAELDAEHAEEYAANAAELRTDLEALDAEYTEALADCARDTVVVNHDAFGYLARYGLHLEPIVGLSPEAEPTPADLVRLQELIREEDITTVFAETLVSQQAAETLAGDLGLDVAVLDPVEGLTDETADEDYLSLMRANLDELTEANGC